MDWDDAATSGYKPVEERPFSKVVHWEQLEALTLTLQRSASGILVLLMLYGPTLSAIPSASRFHKRDLQDLRAERIEISA